MHGSLVTRCQLGREGGWIDFLVAMPLRVAIDAKGRATGVSQAHIGGNRDVVPALDKQDAHRLTEQAEAYARAAVPSLARRPQVIGTVVEVV